MYFRPSLKKLLKRKEKVKITIIMQGKLNLS